MQDDKPASGVDRERVRQSMERLFDIYRDISATADQVIRKRCPYKDAKSRCTAKFGCRHQFFTRTPGQLPVCTGSDKLDYRSAWELDAEAPGGQADP